MRFLYLSRDNPAAAKEWLENLTVVSDSPDQSWVLYESSSRNLELEYQKLCFKFPSARLVKFKNALSSLLDLPDNLWLLASDGIVLERGVDSKAVYDLLLGNHWIKGFSLFHDLKNPPAPAPAKIDKSYFEPLGKEIALYSWNGVGEQQEAALDLNCCIYRSELVKQALSASLTLAEFQGRFHTVLFREKHSQHAYASLVEAVARKNSLTAASVNSASHSETGSHPRVSVIVPTYNRGERLREAIESILTQSFQDFEIVVVNDAGEPVSEEILSLDSRIKYVEHQTNSGLAATRCTAIENSSGELISYLDDDDRYYHNHLELLVSALDSSSAEFVYSDSLRAWEAEAEDQAYIWKRDQLYSEDHDGQEIFYRNITPVLCVMHTRSIYDRVGGFDRSLKRIEDWDLWRKMALHTELKHLPRITCEFSWHASPDSMTSNWHAPFRWAELRVLCRNVGDVEKISGGLQRLAAKINHNASELLLYLHQGLQEGRKNLLKSLYISSISEAESLLQQICELSPQTTPIAEQILKILKQDSKTQDPFLSAIENLKRIGMAENRKQAEQVGPRKPLVSVIVPLYNAWDYTERMLPTFFDTTAELSVELILVDNASTDNTSEGLKDWEAKAKVIRNSVNRNFAGACNQGAEAAEGEFLVFLNNDTKLLSGWLDGMLRVAQESKDIGIVGNRQLFGDEQTVHHCGMIIDKFGGPDHYLRGVSKNDPRTLITRDYKLVTGSCILIRKEIFEKVKGFDTSYINGYEDCDLCFKVSELGLRITLAAESTIIHYTSKSPGRWEHNDSNANLFRSRWAHQLIPNFHEVEIQDGPVLDRFLNTAPIRPRVGILLSEACSWLYVYYLTLFVRQLINQNESSAAIDPEVFLFITGKVPSEVPNEAWIRLVGLHPPFEQELLLEEVRQREISVLLAAPSTRTLSHTFALEPKLSDLGCKLVFASNPFVKSSLVSHPQKAYPLSLDLPSFDLPGPEACRVILNMSPTETLAVYAPSNTTFSVENCISWAETSSPKNDQAAVLLPDFVSAEQAQQLCDSLARRVEKGNVLVISNYQLGVTASQMLIAANSVQIDIDMDNQLDLYSFALISLCHQNGVQATVKVCSGTREVGSALSIGQFIAANPPAKETLEFLLTTEIRECSFESV